MQAIFFKVFFSSVWSLSYITFSIEFWDFVTDRIWMSNANDGMLHLLLKYIGKTIVKLLLLMFCVSHIL